MATPRAYNARLDKFVEFPDAPVIGSFAITLPLEKGFESFKVLTVQPNGHVIAMCEDEEKLRALAVELNNMAIPWAEFSSPEEFALWRNRSAANKQLYDMAKGMCRAVWGSYI